MNAGLMCLAIIAAIGISAGVIALVVRRYA
jgi:hypothetical protein